MITPYFLSSTIFLYCQTMIRGNWKKSLPIMVIDQKNYRFFRRSNLLHLLIYIFSFCFNPIYGYITFRFAWTKWSTLVEKKRSSAGEHSLRTKCNFRFFSFIFIPKSWSLYFYARSFHFSHFEVKKKEKKFLHLVKMWIWMTRSNQPTESNERPINELDIIIYSNCYIQLLGPKPYYHSQFKTYTIHSIPINWFWSIEIFYQLTYIQHPCSNYY